MLPLQSFQYITTTLGKKPFEFWPETEQKKLVQYGVSATKELKQLLEESNLTNNYAYQSIIGIDPTLSEKGLDEIPFFQHLSNLVGVYKASSLYLEHKKFLDQLEEQLKITKQKATEYHVALEELTIKGAAMSAEEKKEKDLEVLKQIGMFYILEYTIYVLSLFPTLDKEDRRKILYEGLQTSHANLPSYQSFSESFRRDLCLKILQTDLRKILLQIFFDFEEIWITNDIQKIVPSFKKLNIDLLQVLQSQEIQRFKTVFLSPFGKDIAIEDLILKIEAIEL